MVCSGPSSTPREASSAAASPSWNGSTRTRRVTRLCSPPRSRTMFSSIHDAAEPQSTTTSRGCRLPHAFQKCSSAGRKPDLREASHGTSSKKTASFPLRRLRHVVSHASSRRNASCQSSGARGSGPPIALPSATANERSCVRRSAR